MRWLVVLTCTLVAASAAAEQRLVVGQATSGVFYWHGHRVSPPYTVEVGYLTSPETTWTATYLNGLPIDHHELRAPPPVDWADPTLTPDQQALERISYRQMKIDGALGLRLHDRVARQVEILRSERSLVDSVAIRRGDQTTVFWHGQPHGREHDLIDGPSSTPSDWWREGLESARSLREILANGNVVVGSWSRFYFPGRPALDDEIRRFQAGESDSLSYRLNARALAELRSPPPESSLIAQLGYHPWSPPPCGLPRAVAQSEARHVAVETIASDAIVVAPGRRVRAPFELAADCVADPDTTWMTLTVNGELAWRRPSKPVNWIVPRGAPCGRPPEFGMLSFVLRSGGAVILDRDSSIYVPRARRGEYSATIDSVANR